MSRTTDPAVSQETEKRFSTLLEELRDLRTAAAAAVRNYDGSGRPTAEHTRLMFLARAVEASGALDTLFLHGYSQDAGSILRTLSELYIEIRYIGTDTTHWDRYVGFAPLHNDKMARLMTRIYPDRSVDDYWQQFYEKHRNILGGIYPSWQALQSKHDQDVRDAKAQHNYGRAWADRKDPKTGKITRVSTERKAQLADEFTRQANPDANPDVVMSYDVAFRFGSLAVHPSHASLNKFVNITSPSSATISCDPTPPSDALPLLFGMQFLMKIFDIVNDDLKLDAEAPLKKVDAFMSRVLAGEIQMS